MHALALPTGLQLTARARCWELSAAPWNCSHGSVLHVCRALQRRGMKGSSARRSRYPSVASSSVRFPLHGQGQRCSPTPLRYISTPWPSFESVETGFSMATRQSICRRRFCITCRMRPNSSKWLPQLSVPKRSLQVRVLLMMLSRLQRGPRSRWQTSAP